MRFQDVHVERCNSRSTTDRTDEMEHFEDFCRIPSLHGENGMFCKSGKKFFRFEDVHVERCNSRSTTDRTHEMEHFELFCRIPSLHGENGMFCKSGKRSFSDFKMSMLNDVIPGVLRIERMKWSISRFSVADDQCEKRWVCFTSGQSQACG